MTLPPQRPQYNLPNSGHTLAQNLPYIGLIFSIVLAPVGIVLCAIALTEAKKVGAPTQLATAGLIVGIALTVAALIGAILVGLLTYNLLTPFS